LNFIRKNKWYSQSREGYTVSASLHKDVYKFSAWFGKEFLDVFLVSSEAYQCCEDHNEENNK